MRAAAVVKSPIGCFDINRRPCKKKIIPCCAINAVSVKEVLVIITRAIDRFY